VDSDGPKEACVKWGAHWRHMANTTEPSVCDGDAAFLSNYFDHSFYLQFHVNKYGVSYRIVSYCNRCAESLRPSDSDDDNDDGDNKITDFSTKHLQTSQTGKQNDASGPRSRDHAPAHYVCEKIAGR